MPALKFDGVLTMSLDKSLPAKRRTAFTLVELLVVIAIIGVLVALLLAAVQAARESARRASCLNNVRQLGQASHLFHDAKKRFPIGVRHSIDMAGRPTKGTNLYVELLPYFEEGSVSKKWDHDDNHNNVAGGRNATQAQVIKILLCPSDPLTPVVEYREDTNAPWDPGFSGFYGMSSYGGNAGKRSVPSNQQTRDGIFYKDRSVCFTDIKDGTDKTFLFGERYHHDLEFDRFVLEVLHKDFSLTEIGMWGYVAGPPASSHVLLSAPVPINYEMPPGGDDSNRWDRGCAFGSGHPGGANFAFADGSTRFVADDLPLEVLQALSTRAGKEAAAAAGR
jgi:prepilin-type N-terminal cleavage/methylation domain-containing protein/prepilin-type processing-associated H-X9-DG protein